MRLVGVVVPHMRLVIVVVLVCCNHETRDSCCTYTRDSCCTHMRLVGVVVLVNHGTRSPCCNHGTRVYSYETRGS